MSRLPSLDPAGLKGKQRQLYEAISGDARRNALRKFKVTNDNGALGGPFNVLLYAPEVGDAVQALGGALRFESSLPGHLREFAILFVAQRWRANYEWFTHAPIAEREGLEKAVIDGLKAGNLPEDAPDDVLCIHRFVTELMETRRVSDETYRETCTLLGEQGVVELITLVGHYALLAGLLNTFEVPVPEGETSPFGD